MRKYGLLYRTVCLFGLMPVLSSCGDVATFKLATAGVTAAAHGLFSNPEVNLKEKNYAAADYLVSKINHKIDAFDDIVALPLEEADHEGITSPLGMQIPEGVGLRLMELGYAVWLSEVEGERRGLYPSLPKDKTPDYYLKGRYAVHTKDVDVMLQMVDAKTGLVVGMFNYTMPLTHDLRELAKTETRIFRVQQK